MAKDLYTIEAFADVLGVSTPTASRIVSRGEIASLSDGRRSLVTHDAIKKYLSDNNLVSAPEDHPRISSEIPSLVSLSFFSGALGLDLGMERAGIKAMLYCEFDRKCRMTIEANRPEAALIGDINKTSADEVCKMAGIEPGRRVDVIFGGPPCQAFSTAGARRAFGDARGNVFLRYLDIASELNPSYLVIENVRGLLSTAWPIEEGGEPVHGGAMRYILDKLASLGYQSSFELYNAANFGAPQIRERVVLIAKKGSKIRRLTQSSAVYFSLESLKNLFLAYSLLYSATCSSYDNLLNLFISYKEPTLPSSIVSTYSDLFSRLLLPIFFSNNS